MPYRSIAELPERVRTHMPKDAQRIYRQAFNHAWQEYAEPSRRRRGASREETAHRVAWAAVKAKYVKRGERWVERGRGR